MSFIILPDSPAAESLARRHNQWDAKRMLTHTSGRPWVIGDWADDRVDVVTVGERRLAIFGCTSVTTGSIARALADAKSTADLNRAARRIAGCVHITATFGGRTWSRGSLSTARQIFYSEIDDVTIAADSPWPLAALRKADFDDQTIALGLLVPAPPWPLSQRPIWRGVSELAVGHWLEIASDGRSSTSRWWEPPPADQKLSDIAQILRRELVEALSVRVRRCGNISSDLSGGLDSTSLCFLSAAAGADLLTYHWAPKDRTNDDTVWARRAASHLPMSRHRFLGTDEAPTWYQAYSGQEQAGDHTEGPATWTRNKAHMERLARADAAEGIRLHLLGLGGDELFAALPTYLWSLVRAHPLQSIPTINRRRAANRWSISSTIRGLADSSHFGQSLAATADQLTAPESPPSQAPFGWGDGYRMPPWATAEAVDAVRRLLRDAAAQDPRPLCQDRVRHQMLESAIYSGSIVRQVNTAFSGISVEWSAPYLDDHVIDAAMRLRVEDRAIWGTYKPLLTAAMRGIVPDEILDRRTKGEYSAEEYDGLNQNRHSLLDMCKELNLARLGMVNSAPLTQALTSLSPETQRLTPLQNTLACEAWLRSPNSGVPAFVFNPGDAKCHSVSPPT
jgi:asparagine synthase (glutamine-hydrolysing)